MAASQQKSKYINNCTMVWYSSSETRRNIYEENTNRVDTPKPYVIWEERTRKQLVISHKLQNLCEQILHRANLLEEYLTQVVIMVKCQIFGLRRDKPPSRPISTRYSGRYGTSMILYWHMEHSIVLVKHQYTQKPLKFFFLFSFFSQLRTEQGSGRRKGGTN